MRPKEAIRRFADSKVTGAVAAGTAVLGVGVDVITHHVDRGIFPRPIAEHCGNFTIPFILPFVGGIAGTLMEIRGQKNSQASIERLGKITRWLGVLAALSLNVGNELQFLERPELFPI